MSSFLTLPSSSSSSFAFGFESEVRQPPSTQADPGKIQIEHTVSEDQWPSPLVIEPGISSLIWPVSTESFLSSYYSKRPFASHVDGGERRKNRLQRLQNEMHDFDVPTLVREATRVVVWMKDVRTGMMNYIDLPPDIALACYHAGHSLYFNPPLEFQKKYISAICEDLGMSFGSTLDGGFGGDVEIFAVKGTHKTPRHFDAQENFTVQLVGAKKWSVSHCPDILHPTTNLHPQSTNRAAFCADSRTLVASGRGRSEGRGGGGDDLVKRRTSNEHSLVPAPTNKNVESDKFFSTDDIKTFTLSPGSTFYLPAGCTHEVICDEPSGSLSINFSISGVRWADFIAKRVMQTMLQDSDARGRIHLVNGSLMETRHHLQKLINRVTMSLSREVIQTSPSSLTKVSDEWLPDGIIELNKRRIVLNDIDIAEEVEDDDEKEEEQSTEGVSNKAVDEKSSQRHKRKRTFTHRSAQMSSRKRDKNDDGDGDGVGDEYGEGAEIVAEEIVSTELSDSLYNATMSGKSIKLQKSTITLMMIYTQRDLPERIHRQERGLARIFSGMGSLINSDAHQLASPDFSTWISFPRSMQTEFERLCKIPTINRIRMDSESSSSSSPSSSSSSSSSETPPLNDEKCFIHTFGNKKSKTLDVLIQVLIHIGFFIIC
jgi:hypothetical protein